MEQDGSNLGAFDRETSTGYLYSQHYRGDAEPVVQAEAIRSRGYGYLARLIRRRAEGHCEPTEAV